jgi:hypothetical protein
MSQPANNDWISQLPNKDREVVATLGFSALTERRRGRRATKQLVPNWREVVYQHCTGSVTLDKGLLAKHLGISVRTLHARLKKPEDDLGDAIRNARGWLSYKLAEPMLRRALADDSPEHDALRLKLLSRIDPEHYNDSLIAARASKGPLVQVDARQQTLTFGKPVSVDEWMRRVQSGEIAKALTPPTKDGDG